MRKSTKSLPNEADAFGPRYKISDEYTMGQFVGGGSYGKVYQCQNRTTGEIFAVKSVSTRRLRPDEQRALASEVDVLKNLHHPNIVRYVATVQTRNTLHIIMHFMECGAISNSIASFGPFPPNLAAIMTRQVLDGLAYLHDQGVIHRDIKCDNILLDKFGRAKLADFGIAVRTEKAGEEEKGMGTPYWMAPEIIQLSPATSACDIWSIGCTVIEMLTGHPPYHECEKAAAIFRIVKDEAMPIPSSVPEDVADMLRMCFVREPSGRPTARALLEHPWLVNAAFAAVEGNAPSEGAGSIDVRPPSARPAKTSLAAVASAGASSGTKVHRHSLPGQMYDSVMFDGYGGSERILSQRALGALGENEGEVSTEEPAIKVSPVVTRKKSVSPRSTNRSDGERSAKLAQYRESAEDADFKDFEVHKLEFSLKERSFRDLLEADAASAKRDTNLDENGKNRLKLQGLLRQMMSESGEAEKSGVQLLSLAGTMPDTVQDVIVRTNAVWTMMEDFSSLSVAQQLGLLKVLVKVANSKSFLELLMVAGALPVLTRIFSLPGYTSGTKPSPVSELKRAAADLITLFLRTNPVVLHTFVASGGAEPLVALCNTPSVELSLIALDGVQRIFNETLAPAGSQRRKSFSRATKRSSADGVISKNDLCLLFSKTSLLNSLASLGERLQSDEGRRESFQCKVAPLGALAEVCHVFLVFSRESAAAKTYLARSPKAVHFLLKTLQMRWMAVLTNRSGEELNDDDLDAIRALLTCVQNLAGEPLCLDALEGSGAIETLASMCAARSDASATLRKNNKRPISPESLAFVSEIHNFAFVILFVLIRMSSSRQERAAACGMVKLAVRAVEDKTQVKPFAMQMLCDFCSTSVHSDFVKSLLLKEGALTLLLDSLAVVTTKDAGEDVAPSSIWHERALQGFSQLLSASDLMMLKSEVHREVERQLLSPKALVRYCDLLQNTEGKEFEMVSKLLLRIMESNPKLAEAVGRSGVLVSEIAARFASTPKAEVQIDLLKMMSMLTGRHTDLENLLLDHNLYSVISSVLAAAKQHKLVVVATHAEQLIEMWKPAMERLWVTNSRTVS